MACQTRTVRTPSPRDNSTSKDRLLELLDNLSKRPDSDKTYDKLMQAMSESDSWRDVYREVKQAEANTSKR